MFGELRYRKRPVDFTYPSEEAMWHADNPPADQRLFDNSIQDKFSIVKERFTAEFTEFKNFLDGKLDISAETYFLMFDCKLYYIQFPELFEKDIEGLGVSYWNNIDWVDRAWIKNTRDLIKEYHAICIAEQIKIWPEMAKGEK